MGSNKKKKKKKKMQNRKLTLLNALYKQSYIITYNL